MTYYVLDTNVLIDYVGLIPNGEHVTLEKTSVDLAGNCLVIPTVVVKELDKFKAEQTDRGRVAREILRRLDHLTEENVFSAEETLNLKALIRPETCDYAILVLPIDYRYREILHFNPAKDDMDGQIILTALSALCTANAVSPEVGGGVVDIKSLDKESRKKVVLLSNDRGVLVRARGEGLVAKHFRYSIPSPYTGRRDLAVPDDLFKRFLDKETISEEEWCQALPNQPPLVANEFLIMQPESGIYPENYAREEFRHVGRFYKPTGSIMHLQYWDRFSPPDAKIRPRNEGQAIYAEALCDPSISAVICTGPAGTGKTFMSTVYALEACKKGRYDCVTVIPCDPDSSDKLGALPGDLDAKMDPSVRPHKNALENYLLMRDRRNASSAAHFPDEKEKEAAGKSKAPKPDNKQQPVLKRVQTETEQLWENWFRNHPVYLARGLSFPGQIVLYDEFQDQSPQQALTLLTRKGENSKMIITGDIRQVRAKYLDHDNNGLVFAQEMLKGSLEVAQITFIPSEIVRDSLVQFIIDRSTNYYASKTA